MAKKHLIHKNVPVPFSCEDCKHFIGDVRCEAFDMIPLEFYYDAESHDKVVDFQKGDFVFSTSKPRQYDRVYSSF